VLSQRSTGSSYPCHQVRRSFRTPWTRDLDNCLYGCRPPQGGHGVLIVAELGEYLAGVLPDVRDRCLEPILRTGNRTQSSSFYERAVSLSTNDFRLRFHALLGENNNREVVLSTSRAFVGQACPRGGRAGWLHHQVDQEIARCYQVLGVERLDDRRYKDPGAALVMAWAKPHRHYPAPSPSTATDGPRGRRRASPRRGLEPLAGSATPALGRPACLCG
jgi:hypothetical protein